MDFGAYFIPDFGPDLSQTLPLYVDKPFVCNECNAAFTCKQNLRDHTRVHSGEEPYKCGICDTAFANRSNLRRHVFLHTGQKPHKCDVCGRGFAQRGDLRGHMITHTGENGNKSEVSVITDSGRTNEAILEEKPFKCDICGAAFNAKGSLKHHAFVHTGEKPHICEVCGAAFSKKGDLRRHSTTHSGVKRHKCEECGSVFSQSSHLIRHKLTHTGGVKIAYKCSLCDVEFTAKRTLHHHILAHTGGKPHKCEECGSAFAKRGDLHRHLLTHSGEKPHKCDECGNEFTQSSHLIRHKRTHNLEKPFICEVCGATYRRNDHLRRHALMHMEGFNNLNTVENDTVGEQDIDIALDNIKHSTSIQSEDIVRNDADVITENVITSMTPDLISQSDSEQPHASEWHTIENEGMVKEESGTTPYDLTQSNCKEGPTTESEAVNGGVAKTFKCDECSKEFAHSSHLGRHKKTHTLEKPFKCDLCGSAYGRSDHLRRHAVTHIDVALDNISHSESARTQMRDRNAIEENIMKKEELSKAPRNSGLSNCEHARTEEWTTVTDEVIKMEPCLALDDVRDLESDREQSNIREGCSREHKI